MSGHAGVRDARKTMDGNKSHIYHLTLANYKNIAGYLTRVTGDVKNIIMKLICTICDISHDMHVDLNQQCGLKWPLICIQSNF